MAVILCVEYVWLSAVSLSCEWFWKKYIFQILVFLVRFVAGLPVRCPLFGGSFPNKLGEEPNLMFCYN